MTPGAPDYQPLMQRAEATLELEQPECWQSWFETSTVGSTASSHHASVIDIKGKSYRLHEAMEPVGDVPIMAALEGLLD